MHGVSNDRRDSHRPTVERHHRSGGCVDDLLHFGDRGRHAVRVGCLEQPVGGPVRAAVERVEFVEQGGLNPRSELRPFLWGGDTDQYGAAPNRDVGDRSLAGEAAER